MNAPAKKIILLLLAAALVFSSGQFQKSMNSDRAALGLTIAEPLQNAPPMLAFTTVALGGFRGLISNYLWIRANDLQQDDKFFEAAQLSIWITDLEPHFAQVWAFQSWNMAWNISVKFKDFSDRWRWVQRGIELLRDNGLRYNPDDTLLYQQLGWIFQSKLGQNMDDANIFYKQQWAKEMTPFFGASGTNFSGLISPQTSGDQTNAFLLREKYKIDPAFAQKVDAQYGPLDWRLPEAHAIYWGARGLDAAKENPGNVKAEDNLGLCLEGKNQIEQAIAAYQKAIALDESSLVHTEQPYLNLGILQAKHNNDREALLLLAKAQKIAPQSAEVHYQLAKSLFSLNRVADAQREVETAVQLNPKDAPSHYLLGRIYHTLGKSDLSVQQFKLTEDLLRSDNGNSAGMASGDRK